MMKYLRLLAVMGLVMSVGRLSAAESKVTLSPSIHGQALMGIARGFGQGSVNRTFGTYVGVQTFLGDYDKGRMLLGGAGLVWSVEKGVDNNAPAVTVSPVAVRIHKGLYASVGITHVFAAEHARAANAVHAQVSFRLAGRRHP